MQIYGVNSVSGTPNPKTQVIKKDDEKITIDFEKSDKKTETKKTQEQLPKLDVEKDEQGRVTNEIIRDKNGKSVGYRNFVYEGDGKKPSEVKEFDMNGNLKTTSSYSYNEKGGYTVSIQSEEYADYNYSVTYDAKGRKINSVDYDGAAVREYADDNAEKPIRIKFYKKNGKLDFIAENKYDSKGRNVETQYLDARGNLTGSRVIEYNDEAGVETETSLDAKGKIEYRVKTDMKTNKRLEWFNSSGTEKYTYNEDGSYSIVTRNPKGKLVSTDKYNAKGQQTEHNEDGVKTQFYYDNEGRVTLEKVYENGELTTIKHEYNKQGQETKKITKFPWGIYTDLFKYDAKGNKTQEMTYNEDGQFVNGWHSEYDKNGNYTGGYRIDENGKRIPETNEESASQAAKRIGKLTPGAKSVVPVKPLGMQSSSKMVNILPNGCVERRLTPVSNPTYYSPDGKQISEQEYKDYQTGKKKWTGNVDYLKIAEKTGELKLSNGVTIKFKGHGSLAKEKFSFELNGKQITRQQFERKMLEHTNPKKAKALDDESKKAAEGFKKGLKNPRLPKEEEVPIPFASKADMERYKRIEKHKKQQEAAKDFEERFLL